MHDSCMVRTYQTVTTINQAMGVEGSCEGCIDPEQRPVRKRIYGAPYFDNRLAGKHISNEYLNIFDDEIDL